MSFECNNYAHYTSLCSIRSETVEKIIITIKYASLEFRFGLDLEFDMFFRLNCKLLIDLDVSR